jgi:phage terminase large subunit-like protein
MSKQRAAPKPKTQRTNTSTPDDPVTDYALKVVAGEIIAGPYVRGACERHLRDLKQAPRRGLVWNLEAATRAIEFFPDVLRLVGGQFEGQPFFLEPSQQFKTGSLFGWQRRDGTRRFRRAYIEEAKGNGKSPWAAGIGLYGMMADSEPRAEIYAAAAKKDQAMVMFRDAVAMVEQSPALNSKITKSGVNPVWSLAHLPTGSFFRPISNDDSQSGPRPYFALCDEIHEHKNRTTVDMLERGFKFRRQPLLIMITNSGTDRNSVCWEEHQHAVKVALGDTEDDSTFSFVCALDEGDDPLEHPECWAKANPLLGVTITAEYLAGVVQLGKAIPGKLNGILRLHFCVWTDAEQAWMSGPALRAVAKEFDPMEHEGEDVVVGLDLSATRDLTAMAFARKTGEVEVERMMEDGSVASLIVPTFDTWCEIWTPEETLGERALMDQAPYEEWARKGWLRTTPGKTVRLGFVAASLARAAATYNVRLVAYDRYAYRQFEIECQELGLTIPFAEHPQGGKRRAKANDLALQHYEWYGGVEPQGLWMPGSIKELENLILEGRIRIQNNPVVMMAFMSAVTEADPNDNRWFVKRKATNRIDPAVSTAMAIGAAIAGLPNSRSAVDVGEFLDNAVVA